MPLKPIHAAIHLNRKSGVKSSVNSDSKVAQLSSVHHYALLQARTQLGVTSSRVSGVMQIHVFSSKWG